MAKTLYHGGLRDQSPVTLTVKSGPMKSKFSKPNAPKPDYCILVIGGEEFSYALDSQQCANFITQHKGQTLTICAEGSREESTLTAVGAPGTQTLAPKSEPAAQTPPTPPRPAATAPQNGDQILDYARKFIARNRVLTVLALEAAWYTKMEFERAKQFEMDPQLFTAVYSTMLYGASQAGIKGENVGLPLDMNFKPGNPNDAIA